MKRRYHRVTECFAAVLTTGLLALPAAHAAQFVQTVASAGTTTEWDDAIWGTPAAAPTSGNTYQSTVGLVAASSSGLGLANDLTGRVRAYAGANGNPTFAGDSVTIIGSTELLVKDGGTYSANVILNGGILRFSPNAAANATLTGTINVAANSVLGSVQSAASTFTIGSNLTGSSTLRLATGTGTNQTLTFDDGVGTSLNGFSGTLDIGGGTTRAIVDFNRPYVMNNAGITMGKHATADVLNLGANISVKTFTFNSTGLESGTYDVATLNTTFGNGSQFTGVGTLTVAVGPDSDNDFLPDSWEMSFAGNLTNLNGTLPAGSGPGAGTGDFDGDGLSDGDEYSGNTIPNDPDSDDDGLKDGPEVAGTKNDGTDHGFGPTDALDADSDNDGFSDWFELELATNPNDSESLPGTAVPIVNGGFESPPVAVSTEAVPVSGGTVPGWTAVVNDFYVIDFLPSGLGVGNPGAPSEGSQFATADRRAPDPDVDATSFVGGTAATMSMRQDIDMSSLAAQIDAGTRSLRLSFNFFDNDVEDQGVVTMRFLDGSNNDLGRRVVYRSTGENATWRSGLLTGHPPVGTRTVRLTVEAVLGAGGVGTARNFAVDNMQARLFHHDSDNDNMPDDWEMANGLNLGTNDSDGNGDSDGLTNLQEFQRGTNPKANDTDGDTYHDDVEVSAGSDPLDSASIPVIAPADIKVVSTNVTKDGAGQVTQVQVTFSGLNTAKTYALKRGTDLVTFPTTVDTHQPASEAGVFTDSSPLPQATSGKAFYILVDAP
jgi:hypothetical protein